MPDLRRSLGFLYLEGTRFDRGTIRDRHRPRIAPAEPFKLYPDAERIPLSPVSSLTGADLADVLRRRRSKRDYSPQGLSFIDLSALLWASQGVTATGEYHFLRTAPSAGALYPIETYVAVGGVEGLAEGLYHLDVRGYQLERIGDGPVCGKVAQAALDQDFLARAGAIFIWSAVLRRTMAKYGHRGLRYIFLDAGHICQNLLLASTALGLAACPVAAFYDMELDRLLGLDSEEETVIYLAGVGRPG